MKRQEASQLVESLFDAWGPGLARHVYFATGSRELAEDLVQEAFMALYRELGRGKTIANARAWTLTVVRHHIGKYERAVKRHGEQLEPFEVLDAFEAREDGQPDTERDLQRMLPVLTPREGQVLLLRLESMKYREIAEHLGINAKSVATLLARALRKLQQAVKTSRTSPAPPAGKDWDVRETL
jgi:RNA polymerase sigma-70 factor (ECF subfamily)